MEKSKTRVLLLYLLKHLNQICEMASIPCYASGGTCLGAVRHKGFIPWDDDVDYMIPRKFYQLFVETCEKNLPSPVVIRTRENDPYFCCEYIKLCFKDDKRGFSDVSIDVFLLDETNPKKKMLRACQNFLLTQLYFIKQYKVSRDQKGDTYTPGNRLKQIYLSCMSCMPYRIIDKLHKYLMVCDKSNTESWVNWGSCYSYKKATYLKSAFGVPKKLPFENTYVYVAENPEEILIHLYGENYMVPPPLEKRTDHGVRQLCCDELNYDKIKKEVEEFSW